MQLILKSAGNPDHGQATFQPYALADDAKVVAVRNFQEASTRCKEYIDANALGGGNWSGGQVFYKKTLVAEVAYNGQVWTPGPQRVEIKF